MEITFNPTLKQAVAYQKLHDLYTKYIIFGGGAGGGKSWHGCEWLLEMSLAYPGIKSYIGRNKLKDIKRSTYITFQKVCKHHNIPRNWWKFNAQDSYIEFYNGSRIDFLDLKFVPSDPLYEDMGSTEYTIGWIEEAGEVHFAAFDTLKSRMGRHLNKEYNIPSKIFITCNPKKNWLYLKVYKPWREGTLNPKYCFIQSLYHDNPHTVKEYADNLADIDDKAKKERLMFGNWEYDDDPSLLFDYDSLCDIFTNEAERGKKYLTVDVSGGGKDSTELTYWDGLFIYKKESVPNISPQELDAKLIKHKIPRSQCAVDEDGVGWGIVSGVKGVQGFLNGSSPIKTKTEKKKFEQNYAHLKDQCWFLLAKYVNDGKIGCYRDIPEDYKKLLTEDLEIMKEIDKEKESKKRVMTKEMVHQVLGRSTDHGDSMMMRMIFELKTTSFKARSG